MTIISGTTNTSQIGVFISIEHPHWQSLDLKLIQVIRKLTILKNDMLLTFVCTSRAVPALKVSTVGTIIVYPNAKIWTERQTTIYEIFSGGLDTPLIKTTYRALARLTKSVALYSYLESSLILLKTDLEVPPIQCLQKTSCDCFMKTFLPGVILRTYTSTRVVSLRL